jgi:Tol biopolymer transport system component
MNQHFRLIGVVMATLLAWPTTGADAQYFGRNKVQYKTFDFEVMATEHFDIYFYEEEREAVEIAARLAERWYARLSTLLEHRLSSRQPLILYASHPDFEQTNVIGGGIGETTGGVTEGLRRRIVMPLAGPLAETDHVLGHELVHAFQYDIAGTSERQGQPIQTGLERLPLWFIEGMAEYLSIGPHDPHTAMWMRDAVASDRLPRNLNDPRVFPYRWGHAWWSYVSGRWGDGVVGDLLRAGKVMRNVDDAIREVLGVEPDELMTEWHAVLRDTYGPSLERTQPATTFGRQLVGEARLGGQLNVSPALSPDGTRMAFLSERGLFSIDVYLADAQTGEIIRQLTSTAFDPHTSTLQFMRSAGAWSPDGRQLAVPAVQRGRPAILFVDASNGDITRRVPLPDLHEVFNPAWSPDGRTLAFTAIDGGLTDLFTIDLESERLTRLTQDPYAQLQPAWSPDGRSIVYVTDRFTSNLDALQFGDYRLAMIAPDGSNLRQVSGITSGKALNPQWSADGRQIYFLSDANGATNVWSVDLAGNASPVTNLQTGVSGITAASPALSVAAQRMVVSAYEQDAYRLYAIDLGDRPRESAVQPARVVATLPPLERRAVEVARLVGDPQFGLPRPQPFEVTAYRPRLGLDYVAQPSFAAGIDRFGTFGGGGVAFFWGDMLGDHNLATAVQLHSGFNRNFTFRDTAALVGYQNVRHRWNWGVSAEQVPYVSGFIRSGFDVIDGQQVIVEERRLSRQVNQAVTGMVAYPFSRAQRIEFAAGARRIGFDEEVDLAIYSAFTGQLLAEQTRRLPSPGALNLGQASAALVYDNSFFGATSPVLGQRYRLEVTPLFGSIQFSNVLADYRRYFMPAQFYTLAGRVMHFGRYGADAESPLLSPLFLGYPTLVRGYDVGSFSADECPGPVGACPVFDRLLGSRMLVANLEFRFPLLRPFGVSRGMYGPLPVELALFADTGVAWGSGERPDFLGGERRPVSSIGTALRTNVFGFAVAQFAFVRPLDRPQRGWVLQFSLAPGF